MEFWLNVSVVLITWFVDFQCCLFLCAVRRSFYVCFVLVSVLLIQARYSFIFTPIVCNNHKNIQNVCRDLTTVPLQFSFSLHVLFEEKMEGLRPVWAVKVIMVIVIGSIFFRCVSARNYTVGGPNGWDLASNLGVWSRSVSFYTGDNLGLCQWIWSFYCFLIFRFLFLAWVEACFPSFCSILFTYSNFLSLLHLKSENQFFQVAETLQKFNYDKSRLHAEAKTCMLSYWWLITVAIPLFGEYKKAWPWMTHLRIF